MAEPHPAAASRLPANSNATVPGAADEPMNALTAPAPINAWLHARGGAQRGGGARDPLLAARLDRDPAPPTPQTNTHRAASPVAPVHFGGSVNAASPRHANAAGDVLTSPRAARVASGRQPSSWIIRASQVRLRLRCSVLLEEIMYNIFGFFLLPVMWLRHGWAGVLNRGHISNVLQVSITAIVALDIAFAVVAAASPCSPFAATYDVSRWDIPGVFAIIALRAVVIGVKYATMQSAQLRRIDTERIPVHVLARQYMLVGWLTPGVAVLGDELERALIRVCPELPQLVTVFASDEARAQALNCMRESLPSFCHHHGYQLLPDGSLQARAEPVRARRPDRDAPGMQAIPEVPAVGGCCCEGRTRSTSSDDSDAEDHDADMLLSEQMGSHNPLAAFLMWCHTPRFPSCSRRSMCVRQHPPDERDLAPWNVATVNTLLSHPLFQRQLLAVSSAGVSAPSTASADLRPALGGKARSGATEGSNRSYSGTSDGDFPPLPAIPAEVFVWHVLYTVYIAGAPTITRWTVGVSVVAAAVFSVNLLLTRLATGKAAVGPGWASAVHTLGTAICGSFVMTLMIGYTVMGVVDTYRRLKCMRLLSDAIDLRNSLAYAVHAEMDEPDADLVVETTDNTQVAAVSAHLLQSEASFIASSAVQVVSASTPTMADLAVDATTPARAPPLAAGPVRPGHAREHSAAAPVRSGSSSPTRVTQRRARWNRLRAISTATLMPLAGRPRIRDDEVLEAYETSPRSPRPASGSWHMLAGIDKAAHPSVPRDLRRKLRQMRAESIPVLPVLYSENVLAWGAARAILDDFGSIFTLRINAYTIFTVLGVAGAAGTLIYMILTNQSGVVEGLMYISVALLVLASILSAQIFVGSVYNAYTIALQERIGRVDTLAVTLATPPYSATLPPVFLARLAGVSEAVRVCAADIATSVVHHPARVAGIPSSPQLLITLASIVTSTIVLVLPQLSDLIVQGSDRTPSGLPGHCSPA